MACLLYLPRAEFSDGLEWAAFGVVLGTGGPRHPQPPRRDNVERNYIWESCVLAKTT
jgi:hypothetical protein